MNLWMKSIGKTCEGKSGLFLDSGDCDDAE